MLVFNWGKSLKSKRHINLKLPKVPKSNFNKIYKFHSVKFWKNRTIRRYCWRDFIWMVTPQDCAHRLKNLNHLIRLLDKDDSCIINGTFDKNWDNFEKSGGCFFQKFIQKQSTSIHSSIWLLGSLKVLSCYFYSSISAMNTWPLVLNQPKFVWSVNANLVNLKYHRPYWRLVHSAYTYLDFSPLSCEDTE